MKSSASEPGLSAVGCHRIECAGYISHAGTTCYNIHSTELLLLVRFCQTLKSSQWTKKVTREV